MLSGINVKPASVTEAEVQAFLDGGGVIEVIKSKVFRGKHAQRTKAHQKWSPPGMKGGRGGRPGNHQTRRA